jgi:hypothetical protein
MTHATTNAQVYVTGSCDTNPQHNRLGIVQNKRIKPKPKRNSKNGKKHKKSTMIQIMPAQKQTTT